MDRRLFAKTTKCPFQLALASIWFAALLGCSSNQREASQSPSLWTFAARSETREVPFVSKRFKTTVRKPTGPPVIELVEPDPQGRVGTLACSACHNLLEPNPATRRTEELDQFHQQLNFAHGNLTCLACHNPSDYDTLRLADGATVVYPDVMTLCAQCHGPQATAYEHGAHGGMNGYWDLNLGPRTRNNCIDCHAPHQPKFPQMSPTFKPRDRFLEPVNAHAHSEQTHE